MMGVAERLAVALADRYRIERELGQGGMATVYLAHDLRHERQVAIKVLHPDLGAALGGDRFLSEIKTTARLQHPHILPLLDSGAADTFLYYVMPYVAGETLRTRLERERQLPIEDALRIAREVADALGAAHALGIIHRDIKPENILLQGGHALVADFGIALAVQHAAGARMTQTGLSLGTPQYMSPEQAMGEKTLDARSDIYALGAVTYEMLVGEPPFTGPTVQTIVAKVLTERPTAPRALRDTVPAGVEDAVLKALAKLPADRFESASAFEDALGNPAFRTGSDQAVPGAWRAGRGRLVPGLATLSLALALALVWSLTGAGSSGEPTVYDVGLPDSAPMWTSRGTGFAVAPSGDFLVYQAVSNNRGELWYRSLRDATTRRIAGTEDGWQPTISPDGSQLAFFRERDRQWTLEIMPVTGGAGSTLGRGTGAADLQWLPDGRLFTVEGDGNLARWFDPGGGSTPPRVIPYCITPAPIPGSEALLCSGGPGQTTRRIDTRDGNRSTIIWTDLGDTTQVIGSHFQLIDGRYLVYLTNAGDLTAAVVDPSTGRVGRTVRMAAGLGRREFTETGTYAVSASGTLVYALGENRAVGHLVRAGDGGIDTLPVARDAFLRFVISPESRRLAAVVEGLAGEELRIYDLRTGEHEVLARHGQVRQPLWSPSGDRVLYSTWSMTSEGVPLRSTDSVFVGSPGRAGPPQSIASVPGDFEPFAWLRDGRVIGVLWASFLAVALHVEQRPVRIDTLLTNAGFVQPSPDGRWIAYNPPELTTLWLEPLPRDGRRFQIAAGNVEDARWLSPTELVYSVKGTQSSIYRVRIVPTADPPLGERRRWLDLPEFRETEGQSFNLSPDGRVVYVRGNVEAPVHYLRIVPNWVERMKRAVDEANR